MINSPKKMPAEGASNVAASIAATLDEAKESWPELLDLVSEWRNNVLVSKEDEPFSGNVDQAWMWHVELEFLLRYLLVSTLMKAALHESSTAKDGKATAMDGKILEKLFQDVKSLGIARLAHHTGTSGDLKQPRIMRLSEKYKLSDGESRLMHWFCVMQGAQSLSMKSQMMQTVFRHTDILFQVIYYH